MATKIVTTGPSERKIFVDSKTERLVNPELVAKALGAELVVCHALCCTNLMVECNLAKVTVLNLE